ncbi:DUF1735 and LamG domain-containing protein [Prevotella sp. kh1p2]|uniref:DUF1735 and LamG domain-containing protein n=1 Tax=Prevotella sp. kh1p2 TaxID=1761883 RepID=UPI0008ADC432|nr:DUF1735 and LamG domain-containing protein [Prevotella sp. kh1p2]SES85545.1 Concanavalin A-like lectin/glucanases superfamily protein [Prevotella sp. kh1p2]SNU11044.1 Concanavalin A-like lectin/glucanases superfamily protein [Prevotellaceae bacterium KH2P17]
MKHIFQTLGIASLTCFAWSCANVDYDKVNEENDLPNAVYIDGAAESPVTKIMVNENGGHGTLTARAANLLSGDVNVKFAIDEQVLAAYNEANGTAYQMLPAKYYSLSKETLTIGANEVSNGAVDVTIKPLDNELSAAVKYAIPVKLVAAEGSNILASSATKIFAIDRVLNTTVMRQDGFYLKVNFTPAFQDLQEWTLSYGMNIDSNFDNQSVLSPDFYSRITRDGGLQMKVGETDDPKAFAKTKLQPKKWYHVAWVYNRQHVKCYINGILDNEFDVPKVETFSKMNMSWGAFKGLVREIRLYNKAQSAFQILDNLYIENPENPDLLFYAPLTKEYGVKDICKNPHVIHTYAPEQEVIEYDQSKIKWIDQKFPE